MTFTESSDVFLHQLRVQTQGDARLLPILDNKANVSVLSTSLMSP